MCGIFGHVGNRDSIPVILEGLQRLAYRGYDSSGLATLDDNAQLIMHKAAGRLENLVSIIAGSQATTGKIGIGHTRWATHGEANDINAHPHADSKAEVVVVHNGIVENYLELREELTKKGYLFVSATDSEVIPNLIQQFLHRGHSLEESVRKSALKLEGAHAIACIYTKRPGTIIALKIGNAGGISVGYGKNEMFLASDIPALQPFTRTISPLLPGQMAVISSTSCDFSTLDGHSITPKIVSVASDPDIAAKSGYKHFMMKEIMEQPESAMSALRGRLSFEPESINLNEIPYSDQELRSFSRVVFLGMGSSLHAAQYGARITELLARIPATAENASEFRYRNPVIDRSTLVISVGQSGETADTLEAMNEAINRGGRCLTICNVERSQASQLADGTLLMHAGSEIGVAASKTFTNSLICLHLIGCYLGLKRGVLNGPFLSQCLKSITQVPSLIGQTLSTNAPEIEKLAQAYAKFPRFLFIGRGLLEPIAREGALKLKEISYIQAEGMPAAELKHGPIALIDDQTPVVAFAPSDSLYVKMISNISEVRARKGPVLAIATEGNRRIENHTDHVIRIPVCDEMVTPIISVTVAQLFAYYIAEAIGCDIDQPRNLAKSVTVE